MIPIAEPYIRKAELNAVIEAVKSGWVSSRGRFVGLFEQSFAGYHGMKHGISTFNGTAALHLALTALGIKRDDEVIVPSFTFVASANAVRYCGAEPVFVDSHPDYWGIDPAKIEQAITKRTRAIMPVHIYGHACDMDPILAIAKKRKLFIVEDNAEGLGTFYKGRRTGTMSDISCFSFYGNKVMTTGEGGMCLTNHPELIRKLTLLRDHGMNPERRYWHDVVGFNYRMTNIQAAIGLQQLRQLDRFLRKRAQIARWYHSDLSDLKKHGLIRFQPQMRWSTLNHWLVSVLIPQGEPRRQEIMNEMQRHGIETRPFFHPVHQFPPYFKKQRLPVADHISQQGINLPTSISLTRQQVRFVSETLKRIMKS